MEWVDGEPIIINSIQVDGLMVADYKKFFDNYLANVSRLAPPNSTYTDLG